MSSFLKFLKHLTLPRINFKRRNCQGAEGTVRPRFWMGEGNGARDGHRAPVELFSVF